MAWEENYSGLAEDHYYNKIMDNQKLEQKNIVITKIEQLQWGVKISDERGLIYNISKFKKDTQEQTVAYTTLTALENNGAGMKKCFKFVSVPNNQGGQSRYVRIIGEPEMQSESTPQTPQSTYVPEPKYVPEVKPRDYNAENFGKCKHQFLIELFKKYNDMEEEASLSVYERKAEEWAEMSMRILPKAEPDENAEPEVEAPF